MKETLLSGFVILRGLILIGFFGFMGYSMYVYYASIGEAWRGMGGFICGVIFSVVVIYRSFDILTFTKCYKCKKKKRRSNYIKPLKKINICNDCVHEWEKEGVREGLRNLREGM